MLLLSVALLREKWWYWLWRLCLLEYDGVYSGKIYGYFEGRFCPRLQNRRAYFTAKYL